MRWLSQAATVAELGLRSIPQRLAWTVSAALGVAFVVMVMVSILSIARGFRATLEKTGSAANAIVLRSGTDSEMSSNLGLEDTRIIADKPGVARASDGSALASAEAYVIVDLPKLTTGTEANVPLRGVQRSAFELRERLRIVEGRAFEPGRNELIAGRGAANEFAGLEVGSVLDFGETDWTVVGVFEADGSLSESELWCDVAVLQPAYRRGNTFQSVYLRLASPSAFDTFKDSLTTDQRLNVRAVREDEYYATQSKLLDTLITTLGAIVTFLMSIGAVFGAINTMYSAVASRAREIATMRALGFGGSSVVAAVLAESLAIAAAGGAIGGLVAYFAFNGYRATTLNWQSFSQVAFAFRVTPGLIVLGIGLSLLLGLVGGAFPAIRAARLPVATALREL
jgi:putative ABC transport system permease protein